MKCYIHENEEAVGVCKHCSKAVCRICAVANELNFLVCSESCKQEALLYQEMMEKAKMAYGLKPGRLPATIIFLLVFGFLFIIIGCVTSIFSSSWAYGFIPVLFGIGFLFVGGIYYYNQSKSGMRV